MRRGSGCSLPGVQRARTRDPVTRNFPSKSTHFGHTVRGAADLSPAVQQFAPTLVLRASNRYTDMRRPATQPIRPSPANMRAKVPGSGTAAVRPVML